jgi:hypothetical protein
VQSISSTLDDPREHPESISSNHMDMCRFTSISDPGYHKVSGELRKALETSVQGECRDSGRPSSPSTRSRYKLITNCEIEPVISKEGQGQ